MSWLNFVILNGVASIPNLHQISDAGAGEGFMHLHPTRDTELIACGRANTPLAGVVSPSPVVDNGAVTPAILVHGVLCALQQQGFKIRLHCYQLGLKTDPDFTAHVCDEIVVHHCALGGEAALVERALVPELQRQQQAGEAHLIAESGIGGTTFATLWLRHWISASLWFAGSTQQPNKLAVKQQLLSALMAETASLPLDVQAFVASNYYSDPIQRACCALLGADIRQLNLAGGVMMLAPVIAMGSAINTGQISIGTTRWVMSSADARAVVDRLPTRSALSVPEIQFNHSKFSAIRMFEQGCIVEGCGLGASLLFAEQQGIQGDQLRHYLEGAVAPWLG